MATILIVDDHVLNREFLLTLLSYGGHRLLEASDGEEGLALVYAEHPQLIIADILMPNMDGYQFVKRMQTDPSIAQIPIIFYTATYREREAGVMALACGVRWVLPKPSDPEIILKTVQEALGLPAIVTECPDLPPPPAEKSRFSSIHTQLSEYLVELETSSQLMARLAHGESAPEARHGNLERMEQRLSKTLSSLQSVSLRLTALIELGIELAGEKDATQLIGIGCRVAQNICECKYASVGILDESGEHLSHFVTSGLEPAQFVSPAPQTGILGALLAGHVPVRLRDLDGNPQAIGLPASHPPVHSFLGVRIASRERCYGWLYLVDKPGAVEFSEVDERVASTVAAQLSVAWEKLVLYDEIQRNHVQLKNDLAERILLDEDLRRFRVAMDSTADAIFLIDRTGPGFLDVNATACRMLGYGREELLAMGPIALGPGSREDLKHMFDSIIGGEAPELIEVQLQRKDGSSLSVEVHLHALRSGESWIMVAVAGDISERKDAEQRLLKLAHFDPLTGLPNRSLFFDSLKRLLEQAVEHHWVVAVFLLDIDRFKNVNDSLGHTIGDELLRQFSYRLVDSLRIRDTVGHLGGDEFAAILVMPDSQQLASTAVEKIRESLRQPFILQSHEVTVTASIGITVFPNDASDPETLLRYADTAMYQAKDAGRDTYRYFTAEMNAQTLERVTLERALRSAIARNQLSVHYQPQVDLQTGQIAGLEALARWQHPELGMVPPSRFILVAEDCGLIAEIGEWVLRRTCQDIRRWLDLGLTSPRMAINVSPRQFRDPLLAEKVAAALVDMQIEPDMLCLEITETALMQDTPVIEMSLRSIKALGVDLVLDDFGTGFSSLSYLKRFPFNKVKIDRSFVQDLVTNTDDAAISKAIISMAHSLGIRVVAEGVETEAQCDFLSQNMCDEIQGFLFSKALEPALIEALLREDRRLPGHLLRLQKQARTLLLVDDEVNIVAALKRLLRRDNYQILTANSGQEGLDILAQHEVDVIISDQRMPGMTGVEFLRIAKGLYPDTVRIVLSGYTELQSVTDAVNEGAIYKFLTKPWDDAQLRAHVDEAFRGKEMKDENQRLNLEIRIANQGLAAANRQLEELVKQKQQQIIRDEVSLDIVREALQHIPLPVIGLDDDDVVAFANLAAETLFMDAGPILGSDARQLMPELLHATYESGDEERCVLELQGMLFQVIARRMGQGSQSRGKIMTLTRCEVKS